MIYAIYKYLLSGSQFRVDVVQTVKSYGPCLRVLQWRRIGARILALHCLGQSNDHLTTAALIYHTSTQCNKTPQKAVKHLH